MFYSKCLFLYCVDEGASLTVIDVDYYVIIRKLVGPVCKKTSNILTPVRNLDIFAQVLFAVRFVLVSYLAYISNVKREAICASEISFTFTGLQRVIS
jgi:hypothetical protein